jgi:hypothetical protein
MEVKNADLGFIDNDNLGDSFVAIRGEADDVNGAFRTRGADFPGQRMTSHEIDLSGPPTSEPFESPFEPVVITLIRPSPSI